MGTLTDPRPLARVVSVAIWAYLAAEVLLRVAYIAIASNSAQPKAAAALAGAGLLQVVASVVTVVLVGRWIWRTSTNAHGLAAGMSITPGWAVGWFFIPFMNWVKPFESMKEVWQVSHDPDCWPTVPVPVLLRWWWGLWLASNFAANISLQLTRFDAGYAAIATVGLAATVFAVACGLTLLRLVRTLSIVQSRAIAAQAFA